MKYLSFLFFWLILLISCSNEDDIPITGDFEVLKNGEVWNGYASPLVLDTGEISLSFTHDNSNGEDLKSIVIYPFPRTEGVIQLEKKLFGGR